MGRMVFGFGLMAAAVGLLLADNSLAAAQGAEAKEHATRQLTAQRRPHVTIHPRHRRLSPKATRHCVSWLAKEYRPSGTVITPQMRCWWED